METVADMKDLPELNADVIHIWGVHVPDIMDRLDGLRVALSARELEKAARFHRKADRQSSVAARGALRILLSGYTGIAAADIAFNYSENGKPSLVVPQASRLPGGKEKNRQDACDTVSFNVSHSGDWVVLAFGRDRNIGIDVEKIKWGLETSSIASRYYSPEEQALIDNADDKHTVFFQLWARKEAYVKACGSTLFTELAHLSVPLEDEESNGWHFHRLEAGSKYAAAVVTDKPLTNVPCYDFGGMQWDS